MENNNIDWYETDLSDSIEDRNKPYVKIKDGVTELPNRCFCNCNSLEEIHIPNSVKKIGKSCYRDCTELIILFIPRFLGYTRKYLSITKSCDLLKY